jgi:hypothetical protein
MSGSDAAAQRVVEAFAVRVLDKLEAALGSESSAAQVNRADSKESEIYHVVIADEQLRASADAELQRELKPNAKLVYVKDIEDVGTALKGIEVAKLSSINVLVHGVARDAEGNVLSGDEADFGTKASAVRVLGKWISVEASVVESLKAIKDMSDAGTKQASRIAHPEYWAVRDALRGAAASAPDAEIYLYACNLAQIGGFKDLFEGCGYAVHGSTNVTGPNGDWEIEWTNTGGGTPRDAQKEHASRNLFKNPGNLSVTLAPVYITLLVELPRGNYGDLSVISSRSVLVEFTQRCAARTLNLGGGQERDGMWRARPLCGSVRSPVPYLQLR